jgi:hypothetical protein
LGSLYSIANWEKRHEVSQSRREQTGRLSWMVVPNDLADDAIADLQDRLGEVGVAVYYKTCLLASKCSPRGVLKRDNGEPHTAMTIARAIRSSGEDVAAFLSAGVTAGLLSSEPCPDPCSEQCSEHARSPAHGSERGKIGKRDTTSANSQATEEPEPRPLAALAEWTVQTWNEHALPHWPQARAIRKLGHLAARVDESGGEDAFRPELIERLEKAIAAYSKPIGESGWVPSLRWLLEPNGWEKAAEKATPNTATTEPDEPPEITRWRREQAKLNGAHVA